MRWFLVAILGYASLVLQTAAFRPGALAIPIDGYWTRPDLALLLGLFIALYFEPYEVFVAAWCLGLASDVVSVSGRLGLQALVFSLVCLAVSHVRTAFMRTRVLTHFLLSLAVVAAAHLAWYLAAQYDRGLGMLRPYAWFFRKVIRGSISGYDKSNRKTLVAVMMMIRLQIVCMTG